MFAEAEKHLLFAHEIDMMMHKLLWKVLLYFIIIHWDNKFSIRYWFRLDVPIAHLLHSHCKFIAHLLHIYCTFIAQSLHILCLFLYILFSFFAGFYFFLQINCIPNISLALSLTFFAHSLHFFAFFWHISSCIFLGI